MLAAALVGLVALVGVAGLGERVWADDGGHGAPAADPGSGPDRRSITTDGRAAVDVAVRFALAQLGKPYVFGAQGPGAYDCSGLVQAAYAVAGYRIGRTTTEQDRAGRAVTDVHALVPGDLIFLPGAHGTRARPDHVGMYVGQGLVVQAPHHGDVVRLTALDAWVDHIALIRRVGPDPPRAGDDPGIVARKLQSS